VTKVVKVLAGAAVVLVALYGFGRFFLAQLRSTGGEPGPPGVVLAAPPGFAVTERGELARPEAARELARIVADRPEEPRLALHFTSGGFELFWLVDRSDPAAAILVERSAGPAGVRIETTWRGALDGRLAWAAGHGDFDAPDLAPGERRNLYH
jgi:hypothetical protein